MTELILRTLAVLLCVGVLFVAHDIATSGVRHLRMQHPLTRTEGYAELFLAGLLAAVAVGGLWVVG